jgi:DNA mismatch endonuclease, patch repair protein
MKAMPQLHGQNPIRDVSRRMRAVRQRDTPGEVQLAAALRDLHLTFRMHIELIASTPDIVFMAKRLVVFVDGDFWHGRLALERGRAALENSFRGKSRAFWIAKINRNVERDLRQVRILRRHGWAVLRLWATDVLKNPSGAAAIVCRRLRGRRLAS